MIDFRYYRRETREKFANRAATTDPRSVHKSLVLRGSKTKAGVINTTAREIIGDPRLATESVSGMCELAVNII